MPKRKSEPATPGNVLHEKFMKPHGISINSLARDIDVPPNRVSEIVNGKRAITADTALRLAKYFGVDAKSWMDLQAEHDLRQTEQHRWKDIEHRVRTRKA